MQNRPFEVDARIHEFSLMLFSPEQDCEYVSYWKWKSEKNKWNNPADNMNNGIHRATKGLIIIIDCKNKESCENLQYSFIEVLGIF